MNLTRRHLEAVGVGLLAAAIAFTLVMVALGAVGTVTAQENTTTTTETPDKYVASVDKIVRILDYGYADGTFWVEVEADRQRLLTLSDLGGAVSEGGGAKEIRFKRLTVPAGTSRVELDVTTYRGTATVSIGSVSGAVAISAGGSEPLIGGPFDAGNTQVVGLSGLATGMVLVVVIYSRKREQAQEGATREI